MLVACLLFWQLPTQAHTTSAENKKLVFTHSAYLPPFSYLENGEPKGLLVDWWKLWAEKTGVDVSFKLVPFYESVLLVEKGEADVHMGLIHTQERDELLIFTKPILDIKEDIFVSETLPQTTTHYLLKNNIPVGVVRGDYVLTFLREHYPDMAFRVFENSQELYESVFKNSTRAFAKDKNSFLYASFKYNQEGTMVPIENLFSKPFSAAVSENRPDLAHILNNGMDIMTRAEKEELFNKWIQYDSDKETWIWKNIIYLLVGMGMIALLIHGMILRIQVRRKTGQLQNTLTKLQTQEDRYRRIFENATEGIFLSRIDGSLLDANQAMATLFGFHSPNELITFTALHGMRRLYLDPKERKTMIMELISEKGISNYDVRMTKLDGKSFWARINARPFSEDGKEYMEGIIQDVTQDKAAEQSLIFRATRDALTGLPNRYLFEDRFFHAIAGAKRHERKIAILFIDLNDFKLVNDSYGHHVGDALLRSISERLRARIRESDTCARLGGDEFAVILEDVGGRQEIAKAATELGETISRSYTLEGLKIQVGTSIGIAVYPDDTENQDQLIQLADKAMYLAKKQKLPYVFANDMG